MRNGDTRQGNKEKLEFAQRDASLTFMVVQPDYVAADAIEYRYLLDGLEKDWTNWSNDYNHIDFPYLPPGDYTLKVQTRDIFGRIKDMTPVAFEVLPPYWKTPWFYAFEVSVFAILVLLSFRLSTRFRIVSRVLSLLTIIMLIQLIQTVIGEAFETRTSPVMDFFLQVFVAFMILPVEGYLRNLMLRSLDSQEGLSKLLASKTKQEVERE